MCTLSYEERELKQEYNYLQLRSKLGQWKEDNLPDIETSVSRISWVLNGSYGCGAMLYAKRIIENNLHGKVGKNKEKAFLAIGREITLLVALHDCTEYTVRKISEQWKKQGADFATWNQKASEEVKKFINDSEEFNSYK